MFIPRTDVEIVTFRRSRGNGGQHNNKTATAIRITHIPTGTRVEACKERSRSANLDAAWSALRERLELIVAENRNRQRKETWAARPEPARGYWDRAYFLDRDVRVVDRNTGVSTTAVAGVLSGQIDIFIRGAMLARMNKENHDHVD